MAKMEESPYGTSLDAVAGGGYKEMRWTLSVGGWSTDSTFFKALVQSKEIDKRPQLDCVCPIKLVVQLQTRRTGGTVM